MRDFLKEIHLNHRRPNHGVEAVHGFEQTFAMRRTTEAAFDDVDVILSPTAPMSTFPAEYGHPSNDPEKPFEHLGFTLIRNMGERPNSTLVNTASRVITTVSKYGSLQQQPGATP